MGQSVVELEINATPGFVLQAELLWLDSLEAHALQIRGWVCGCVGVWVCGCVGMWVCGYVGMWVCGYVGVTSTSYKTEPCLKLELQRSNC